MERNTLVKSQLIHLSIYLKFKVTDAKNKNLRIIIIDKNEIYWLF